MGFHPSLSNVLYMTNYISTIFLAMVNKITVFTYSVLY